MQQVNVGLDGLLAQITEEIQVASAAIDLLALARLAELQGQRNGVLRAVRYSQELAQKQHIGPAVPLLDDEPETAPEMITPPTPAAEMVGQAAPPGRNGGRRS